MPEIDPEAAGTYLSEYAQQYRAAHQHLTGPPPDGAGYPAAGSISTYLDDDPIQCLLGFDGWAVVDEAGTPGNPGWNIAGGPAMMIDYEPTVVPQEIHQYLVEQGIWGQNIGIYRIVSPERLPIEIWTGTFPLPEQQVEMNLGRKPLTVKRYGMSIDEILARLTFGVTKMVDLRLPPVEAPFWTTRKLRQFGFTTADRRNTRFFKHLEIGRHLDLAAWDPRSAWARAGVDIRWDYSPNRIDGTITMVGPATPIIDVPILIADPVETVLAALTGAIEGFQTRLDNDAIDDENVYHKYLFEHPILLDVYGDVVSKPRFVYQSTNSPIGKAYVEPDFLVAYPGGNYRLIELERPGKHVDTVRGETRSPLTQAAFQIGEWRDYIAWYPEQLQDRYPGLVSGNFRTTIIIGRDSSLQDGRMAGRYLSLARQQLNVDEVVTYDGLLDLAKNAHSRLAALRS